MNNNSRIGLYEVAFNGAEKGLEVRQYGTKDEVLIDAPINPEQEQEITVASANETMEIPELTAELLNRINANASVRVTEGELARRRAREAYMEQQKIEVDGGDR